MRRKTKVEAARPAPHRVVTIMVWQWQWWLCNRPNYWELWVVGIWLEVEEESIQFISPSLAPLSGDHRQLSTICWHNVTSTSHIKLVWVSLYSSAKFFWSCHCLFFTNQIPEVRKVILTVLIIDWAQKDYPHDSALGALFVSLKQINTEVWQGVLR